MTLVFGLEGHEGCKVAANIIHGFDCKLFSNYVMKNDHIKGNVTQFKTFRWWPVLTLFENGLQKKTIVEGQSTTAGKKSPESSVKTKEKPFYITLKSRLVCAFFVKYY